MHSTPEFIGLNTEYPTADGKRVTRVHLDGAASPLACAAALKAVAALLPHYSNTHSYVHNSAQISTQALAWAHNVVLDFLAADPANYTAIFTGSGSTAAINRVARGLKAARPNRQRVLVSAMEHHANDLPHRQFGNEVIYIPLNGSGAEQGTIDLAEFTRLCKQNSDKVNYVAVSSVSNVTGVLNPIEELTRIAHKFGILVLVDGAQSVAHMPTRLSHSDVDFFVFSGHKVYTPMSPGVLVAKKSLLDELPAQDLGGGSVATVSYFDYQMLSDYPQKEESGTPNIIGAVALATVLTELQAYGLDRITHHDQTLMDELLTRLTKVEGLTVYADNALARVGAVAFNIQNIDHGLLAAILNDYFAIAVRNECFCAHPYVSSMIKEELWEIDLNGVAEADQEALVKLKQGMVRASISLYNTSADIETLICALQSITQNIDTFRQYYEAQLDGSYRHKHFNLEWRAELKL